MYTLNTTARWELEYINECALIGGDDWNCATPDGVTTDDFEINLVLVASLFGQKLELEKYRGHGNIAFLSRQFVNLGAGDPNSCADVPRALGKLHLSTLPAEASADTKWLRL